MPCRIKRQAVCTIRVKVHDGHNIHFAGCKGLRARTESRRGLWKLLTEETGIDELLINRRLRWECLVLNRFCIQAAILIMVYERALKLGILDIRDTAGAVWN